jgi:hypothetical protein
LELTSDFIVAHAKKKGTIARPLVGVRLRFHRQMKQDFPCRPVKRPGCLCRMGQVRQNGETQLSVNGQKLPQGVHILTDVVDQNGDLPGFFDMGDYRLPSSLMISLANQDAGAFLGRRLFYFFPDPYFLFRDFGSSLKQTETKKSQGRQGRTYQNKEDDSCFSLFPFQINSSFLS